MISIPDANAEEKLLFNGLLLCELRSHKRINDKLANLEKILIKGGDVNTHDANDSNNTPLHIAVKKDEPDTVEFLLQKGANSNAINTNNHTPIDLAKIYENKNKNKIIQIIETTTKSFPHLDEDMNKIVPFENKSPDMSSKLSKKNAQSLINETRSGTTGISGHLYESKLLALLLLRALNDHDIETFYIGSNIQGLGAFDDIVFKYYSKSKNKFIILFIQAKHKDVGKFTIDRMLNFEKDFGLIYYFNSFMKVKYKMKQKNNNIMFENDVNSSDLHFILYTTAIENFYKKKIIKNIDKEALLSTSYRGKIFMYDYDESDFNFLLKNILTLQAKSLAKAFAEYIIRKKYENMLLDDLIQVYHVYLSQHVVQVFNGMSEDYLMGRFRKSFFVSKDETLLLIKNTMFKIMKIQNESDCSTLEFKLPKYFGNSEFPISEEEYVDQWNVIQYLINDKENASLDNNTTIAVDDNYNKINLNNLKYLVGDTLILDDKTGLLKLNLQETSSDKNKKIINKLKLDVNAESDFSNFRFEINLQNFPQLLFRNGTYLKKNLTDFLNKLQLHTNQAREDEVEEILIREITSLYNNEHKNSNYFYHIKGEAIYLDYHDRVQKWWKNKTDKLYMTETCNFYEEAKNSLVKSPLLKVYNYIYISKLNSLMLHFNTKVIEDLGLQAFMDCSNTDFLNIVTRYKDLTSIKVKQFFKDYPNPLTFNFLNLKALSEGDSEVILSEIFETKMDVVVLILSGNGPLNDFEIKLLHGQYSKKVIVITPSNTSVQVFKTKAQCLKLHDKSISLCDLDETTRNTIISQKIISFQGFPVSFDSLIGENNYYLVKGDVLYTIIKKGAINIAIKPTSIKNYDERNQFFVNRFLCRCLKLTGKPYSTAFNVIDNNNASVDNNNKDILIISNDVNVFNDNCKKYSTKNIHWFQSSSHKWVKSHGSVKRILPFLERIECDENGKCSSEIQSFKDVSEKVVIINAGPGMGKSTLITHLIKQTKQSDEAITCIIKLNLYDLKNEFWAQRECNDNLKLGWFLSILYKSFAISDTSFLNKVNNEESFDNVTSVDGNKQIHLNSSLLNTIHELSLLEFQVFLNMYNNDKIIIVFDGFDEIYPDYKKEAIELFQLLLNSRIKYLWITTRPVISNELECVVNSVSFILKRFSVNEQIGFLKKYWITNSSQTNAIRNKDLVVTQFLDAISHKIMDHQKYFTSIPLHLRMIAETFLEYYINFHNNPTEKFRENLYDALNLVTLYDKFINVKFYKIRFSEKQCGLSLNDPDMREIIEQQRVFFIKNHKKLAAYTLLHKIKHQNQKFQFSEEKNCHLAGPCRDSTASSMVTGGNGVLTKTDLKQIKTLIRRLKLGSEKTGIIERINQNEPIFVHLTYAEYFANEFICDKLKYNDSTIMLLIDHVLVMDSYEGIRRFFDAKLEKDKSLSNFNSKFVSENLLRQKDSTKSALYFAVMEGRQNIAYFLLNNISTFLQADNLDDFIALVKKKFRCCTVCHTYYSNTFRVLKKIIEVICQVDCNKLEQLFFCGDYSGDKIFTQILLHENTEFHELSNFNTIIKHTNPKIFIKLLLKPNRQTLRNVKHVSRFYKRLIHHLAEDQRNTLYLKCIEKLSQKQCMRVFCARDKLQRVPAHNAAMYSNFDFFEMMLTRVGKENFKKICTLRDINGQIPLQCFSVPLVLDKFKLMCSKVDILIGPLDGGGWFLYDMANATVIYTSVRAYKKVVELPQ